MTDLWHHLAGFAGIQLADEQRALLHRYLDLLLAANETMNLTRITERSAAEVGHVGDALTLLPFLPKGSHGIADVGSGGGVPGIPLAIVRPDAQVILIESTQKKAAFLGRTIEALRLRNVQLIIDRAENAARGNARESFDVVTARAVGALDLLLKANETMNLTRITERGAAEVGHVGDALTLLPFLPKGPHGLADVGSGGGVPGIPLAIARPDAQVILIESTQKKAAFLGKAVEALRLRNVQLIIDRAEAAAHGNARESFDVVTARAVGALNLLVEWCLPLVKVGGKLLAMKGAKVIDELTAADKIISKLGGGPAAIHKAQLPGTEHHVIVEIPKIAATDRQFPRPPTIAKKKPIS